MSKYPKMAASLGDQYLDALAANQDRFLELVSSTQSTASAFLANPAAIMALEATRKVSDASFDYAEQMLERQQRFCADLVAAYEKVAPAAVEKPSAKPRSTKKRATAKASGAKASTRSASKKKTSTTKQRPRKEA